MTGPADLQAIEKKRVEDLRRISASLDSPDPAIMYAAAGKMIAHPTGRALLPKAMSLTSSEDPTVRRLVFRTMGRNAYGSYVPRLFEAMSDINPAEREQVLQVIEETLQLSGAPKSPSEQDRWIKALAALGREHQPTVFGIVGLLGLKGFKWVEKRIREQIDTVTLGSIQKLASFDYEHKSKLVKLLIRGTSNRRRDMLPYIIEILDSKTIQLAAPILRNGNWQERALVASAAGKAGVTSVAGIVTDVVADPDWRVKQAFLEDLSVEKCRFASVAQLLSYLVADSHVRVRTGADRLLLLLGVKACIASDVDSQRKKLMRRFRKQLLRAAPQNKDLDVSWLGVDTSTTDHIPYFEEEGEQTEIEPGQDGPQGVSLEEIGPKQPPSKEAQEEASKKMDLLAALMSAREAAKPQTERRVDTEKEEPGPDVTPSDRFVSLLKEVSGGSGETELVKLKEKALENGFSPEEFTTTLQQLERDGIVYMSGKGQIKYVDIRL